MKVYVVFDFPEVTDPNSMEADDIVDGLTIDLEHFAEETGHIWYIDDAMEY